MFKKISRILKAHTRQIKCKRPTSNASTGNSMTKKYDLHLLKEGPNPSVTINKEEGLKLYKYMVDIRSLEQACAHLYTTKAIRGFCHLYTGQEATGVGLFSSFQPTDTLITAYRCHGFTFLMGAKPIDIVSELTGRITGISRGKGGSMHMYTNNFYGGNGIVGAQVPLGVGLGFRHKYIGNKGVSFTLYGDGAANQGQVFESYNIAKLQSLPVVFVCENNLYAMGTKNSRGAANTDYYKRCEYIPGIKVDGMDLLAVREASRFARDYAATKGPIIMECNTYRYFGHSMSDPGVSYRTREEVSEVRAKQDPIKNFGKTLLEAKLATEEELKAIDKAGKEMQGKLEKEAIEPKAPGEGELPKDVYGLCLGCCIRNVTVFKPLKCALSRQPVNMK